MNLEKLRMAEAAFMNRYPGGFTHVDMQAIGKKHKIDRMIEFAQESFAKKNFRDTQSIIDNMIKVVSRSSMVSVFEKPKFKNFTSCLTPKEKNALVAGLKDQLHCNQQKGFEKIIDLLTEKELHIDLIVESLDWGFSKVANELLQAEFKGLIICLPGKMYKKNI